MRTVSEGPYGPSDGGDWQQANEDWVKQQNAMNPPAIVLCAACNTPMVEEQPGNFICAKCGASAGTADVDMVNHPPHYTAHPSGVECIDIVRHMNFNLGNVVKYLWRSGEKGARLEDLEKAAWYLQDEINRLKEM